MSMMLFAPVVLIIIAVLVYLGIAFNGGNFSMNLSGSLKELTDNQVIDEGQAEKIKIYYQKKKEDSNIAMVILSVIGVILIGLGIILVFAHNWYQIPKFIKLGISIFILIIAQVIFFVNIHKKKTSLLAVEGSSIFLAIISAATIALISQIYHIQGSFEDFMFAWMIMILPIPYIYGSALTGILYMIGITIWANGYQASIFDFDSKANIIMYLLIIPFVLNFITKNIYALRERFVELVLFITMIINLYQLSYNESNIINSVIVFNSILVVILFMSSFFKRLNLNLTKVLAQITIVFQMLIMAFQKHNYNNELMRSNQNLFSDIASLLIILIALIGFYYFVRKKEYEKLLYASTPVLLILGNYGFDTKYATDISFYIINIYLIVIAVCLIITSNKTNNLLKLNAGLVITIILIFKWFADMGFGIIERAIGFIAVGAFLIVINLKILKKKKEVLKNEQVDE
ncbi:MAG TPA: hypothetical protein DCP90_04440 [Clostridiales bacterium]|nr:MAG: hypothetical protein A2Y22_06825 [Clostridiales bacterium GWD2_32_59]HAN09844.1 hypothetical protein [Clostridiales bacterium]